MIAVLFVRFPRESFLCPVVFIMFNFYLSFDYVDVAYSRMLQNLIRLSYLCYLIESSKISSNKLLTDRITLNIAKHT